MRFIKRITHLTFFAILRVSALGQQVDTQHVAANTQSPRQIGGDVIGPILSSSSKFEPTDSSNRPVYPAAPVILALIVDPNGSPQDVRILRSSGMPEADASAARAVSAYHFKPAREHGHTVSVELLYRTLCTCRASLFGKMGPSGNRLQSIPKRFASSQTPPEYQTSCPIKVGGSRTS